MDRQHQIRSAVGAGKIICWIALLLVCSAYLQGGIANAVDFPSAVAEMRHFGLKPEGPLAVLTILGDLGASALILSGFKRWAGALFLAGFTLSATFVANRFWEMADGARFAAENSFFEHLGLTGAFLLIAWADLRRVLTPARRQALKKAHVRDL